MNNIKRTLKKFLFHSIAYKVLSFRRLIYKLVTFFKHHLDAYRWDKPLSFVEIFALKSAKRPQCFCFPASSNNSKKT
ncbi:hypothetical protein CRP01_39090 [Flavilitoribacter nigricans DSM 23189 = NBRC 102662]|uniref:Uncharacterized protein n=1 Tax=Flavilitoribacter nigricans (strain ATCC 23147 / DSM 23189 / NBRC 102662 / NCIMB 1420 / SS-2) TaxID=1122177 RepID=A0A2D0MXZ2_FLAN2|nr:hypothetical protein CRP01_39090 [Flavilitoribacter nigricans DSM 23189 = NBRC 102662]